MFKVRRVRLFFAVIILSFPLSSTAVERFHVEDRMEMSVGVSYTLAGENERAKKVFSDFIENHPEHPQGYFFMAGMYAESITLSHDWSGMANFEKYADLTIKKANKLIKLNKKDPTGYFYLGNIHGYYGLLHGQMQNFFKAFISSVKTVKNLKKSLELNKELYDSYYGLGTIYYYASKKHIESGGMVGWVVKKFITEGRDMRAEALEMLKKAVAGKGITADFAQSVLMWIAISEGRDDDAKTIGMRMSKKYPLDKRPRWGLGRIALLQAECGNAGRHFDKIVQMINRENLPPKSFPEVQNAVEISRVCLEINSLNPKELKTSIKRLRNKIRKDKIVWLEYSNAEDVKKHWFFMLDSFESCSDKRKDTPDYFCENYRKDWKSGF